MKPKIFNKGKQKTTATTQQDLGSDSYDQTRITAMGIKEKNPLLALVLQIHKMKLQMKIGEWNFFT